MLPSRKGGLLVRRERHEQRGNDQRRQRDEFFSLSERIIEKDQVGQQGEGKRDRCGDGLDCGEHVDFLVGIEVREEVPPRLGVTIHN